MLIGTIKEIAIQTVFLLKVSCGEIVTGLNIGPVNFSFAYITDAVLEIHMEPTCTKRRLIRTAP